MSQTLDNLSYTWNNAGTTFTGIKYNVTDTASASGSLLMDLQVGGTSKFKVDKAGYLLLDSIKTNAYAYITTIMQASTVCVGTTTTTNLLSDANNTLAQRNSTNAQEFRLYNTYTDASNYERAKFKWDVNVLKIGTEKAGTGSARALEFQTDGTTRLTIAAAGDVSFPGSSLLIYNPNFSGNQNANITFGHNTNGGSLQSSIRAYLPGDSTAALQFYTHASGASTLKLAISGAGLVQFSGTTSSFPALKRNTTALEAVLADDSGYTNIKGKLTTDTAYAAGAPTATGYLTIYDSTGTAYKIPAVAA